MSWIQPTCELYGRYITGANCCSGAGSDYMSYTKAGYPAAFAAEGDPLSGEFDPYVHGVKDTMDVDDETGYFSLNVSLNLP